MSSRRHAIKTAAAAVAALPILQGQRHDHAAPATATSPYKAKWASAEEMKLMAELCDLIIPRTDTPGASDARVHEYVDYALAGSKQRQTVVHDGLKWFKGIPPDKRLAALQAVTDGKFFRLMKDLTIDGYYQSREGLVQELGWSGNTFLPEFKGCTHPEHQG